MRKKWKVLALTVALLFLLSLGFIVFILGWKDGRDSIEWIFRAGAYSTNPQEIEERWGNEPFHSDLFRGGEGPGRAAMTADLIRKKI